MSVKNRTALKALFVAGATPVAGDFGDLIDSCNNRAIDNQWGTITIPEFPITSANREKTSPIPSGRVPLTMLFVIIGDDGKKYAQPDEVLLEFNPATELFRVLFNPTSSFVDAGNFSGSGPRVAISYLYAP